MDELTNLLGRNGFLPHGYCFQWSPGLLWTMVGADLAIALAYFSIPLTILAYVRKRPGVNLHGVPFLFGCFIFLCGLTHVIDVWTIWQPYYGWQAAGKAATAMVSVFTAVELWRLLPRALKIPSVDELSAAVTALQSEVDRRRSAEEQLHEIEQSLAAALASVDAGFIAADASGRVTRMNAVAERITGWSATAAAGQPLWDVFDRVGRPPDMRARNPVAVLRDSAPGSYSRQPMVCVSRRGEHTPVELSAEITWQGDGTVRGIAIIFRDVARLVGAEADVRRLAAVVESSSDAIIAKTLDGRVTNWNAAAERMFGYRAAEVVGQPGSVLVPADRRDEEMRMLASLAAGTPVPPLRTVRVAQDGRRLEVSVQISPIRDELGRIVGTAKSVRDLTHQRQVEAALRRSEARLRFALESASIGDWEMEIDGGEIRRSWRYDRCFGLNQPLPGWTRAAMLQRVHADDRAATAASLQAALDHAAPWHAEFRVEWPDGSVHWCRMDAKLMVDELGGERLVGIVADVTTMLTAREAREQSRALEAENRRVQESSRMKSLFLANMSHELRTPLNAVIGFADLLQLGLVAPGSPKHHEYLGHIAGAGRHLLQMINDVLDLSKIEAGKLDFSVSPIDLPALIDEVVATLGVQAQARQIDLTVNVAPALEGLELDPSRLKQVLFNFLSNAIKFSQPGGTVQVRATAEGPSMWRLEIEDEGVGIAEQDLPRLFVEFQQLDGSHSRQHQGTGLGLALTRTLVEAQGGRVGVYSVAGQGSRFYAVLPRNARAAAAAPPAPRLLVTAHEHRQRDELARRLAAAGIAADTAGSAADVARLVRTNRYHAMTLDLSLPDASGLAALAKLRAHGGAAEPAIRAIGIRGARAGSVSFPVSDVIGKPLRVEELTRAMAPLRQVFQPGRVVLVVDDDPAARDLMCAALAGIDIESAGAQDGHHALRLLPELQPAAIVLDLLMPGMTGFDVLRALRRDPVWRDLPVFIWSAMSLTPEETAELSRAAQALIDKGEGAADLVLDALVRWAHDFAATSQPAARA